MAAKKVGVKKKPAAKAAPKGRGKAKSKAGSAGG